MSSEIIIFSIGVFVMEDTFNFLKQHSVVLQRVLMKYVSTRYTSSVVRKIGSQLTWIKAHRLRVWKEGLYKNSSFCDEHSSFCDESSSFGDENYSIKSDCEQIEMSPEDLRCSVHWESKFEEFENQLFNLQAKVNQILMAQKSQLYIDERSELKGISPENAVSSTIIIPPSLLLPPPPPPLPPTPFVHTRTVVVKVKSNRVKCTTEKNSIIEELSKKPPKLRHVQLSPGGRPLRSMPVTTDSENILTNVLKKRFEAIHSPQQERFRISSRRASGTPLSW